MIVELGSGRRVDVSTRAVVIARLPAAATAAAVEAASALHADAVHLAPADAADPAGSSSLTAAAADCGLGVTVDGRGAADVTTWGEMGAMILSVDDGDGQPDGPGGWFLAGSLDEAESAAPRGVVDAAALAHADGRPADVGPPPRLDAAALAIEVAAYRRGGRVFLTDDVRRTRRALDVVAEVARHRVAS